MHNSNIKNYIYVFFGSVFDKLLPFLVSFIFIKKISIQDYGLWTLIYIVIIVFNASISSSIITDFNINYFRGKNSKITINEFRSILIILTAVIFIHFFLPQLSTKLLLLATLAIISNVYSNVNLNYLRFKNNFDLYALKSFARISFLALSLLFFLMDNQLTVNEIVLSFFISNTVPFLNYFKNYEIIWKSKGDFKFFASLKFYGFLIIFFLGIDRLILGYYDFDLHLISSLGYASTIISSPTIFTEGFKKYMLPKLYEDLEENEFYSNRTLTSLIIGILILTLLQIVFPFIIFYVLNIFNLIKFELVTENFMIVLLLLSISAVIFNLYHFLNPILFKKKRVKYLISIISFSIILFSIMVNIDFYNSQILIKIAVMKILMSITIISLTILTIKRII